LNHIYLDSNILVAFYATDQTEGPKRKLVEQALSVFAELQNVQLCTSMWSITETIYVLLSKKKMNRADVGEIESQLVNEKRLMSMKLRFVDVSPNSSYDFVEFFYHVRQGILHYHSGVGDIIHSVIMKNNSIDNILTFDEKDDFRQIPGLTVLHPKDVKF